MGHVVFGNIIHTDAHDHYLARVAGINGGLPHETPALILNRLCGSGLQAIITGASRGIGRAIAVELAREGARVAVNDASNDAKAKEVAQDIEALGGTCLVVKAVLGLVADGDYVTGQQINVNGGAHM